MEPHKIDTRNRERIGKGTHDFLGRSILEGDKIVFMQVGSRVLMRGTALKVTAKTVLISHKKTNLGSTKSKRFGIEADYRGLS